MNDLGGIESGGITADERIEDVFIGFEIEIKDNIDFIAKCCG